MLINKYQGSNLAYKYKESKSYMPKWSINAYCNGIISIYFFNIFKN